MIGLNQFIFLGTQSNEILKIQCESSFPSNISNYAGQTGFCDDIIADVITINFTIPQDASYLNFTLFNTENGSVFRNVIKSTFRLNFLKNSDGQYKLFTSCSSLTKCRFLFCWDEIINSFISRNAFWI